MTVLFIAGMGRSGSTLLELLLASSPDVVAAGELRFIWERGLVQNRICGCGHTFRSCDYWREVFETLGGIESAQISAHLEAVKRTRTRRLPLMALPGSRARYARRYVSYLEMAHALYRAIGQAAGAKVIVDSSKYPSQAFLMSLILGLDLRLVHLVRDPRAVAFSWTRRKVEPDLGTTMPTMPIWLSATQWTVWNASIERLGRSVPSYELVRYEDLVQRPAEVTAGLFRSLGARPGEGRIPGQGSGPVAHAVSGNPMRFEPGPLEVISDSEWQRALSRSQQRVVRALTGPVRARYGY